MDFLIRPTLSDSIARCFVFVFQMEYFLSFHPTAGASRRCFDSTAFVCSVAQLAV